ncbi:MAG: recombinase family protein [Clostridium sp.]|uniref:recombinase family protein n=1 Tax=Clostridium sp. TaxID=1506 RepID=UPI0025B86288|nr:recombinase family protein [Clostridium sp.]MCE5222123.1 recombinase family protein [Clostridium sp.]
MRIAIYSRKSIFTGKGDSIENQILMCQEYIFSKLGKDVEISVYEDEGFTGKNTNRPEFQRLMKDIKSKQIDRIVCYKLDRIGRSVAQLSNMFEMLDQYNCSFTSITEQQFDTTTPMGRAMINIASTFAQLEREQLAERVRDNMLQLAKTGRWLGGQSPLGFTPEKIIYIDEEMKERTLMKLTPDEEELNIIRFIFKSYLEEHSINKVTKQLNVKCVKGKNGGNFDTTQVRRMLRNPLYVKSDEFTHKYLNDIGTNVYGEYNGNGYLTYNKKKQTTIGRNIEEWIVAVSNHKGIINSEEWLKVQIVLDKNKSKQSIRLGTGNSNNACLSGVLKCAKCGSNMVVKHGHPSKVNAYTKYDYYVCSNKQNKYVNRCDNPNIRVDRLDPIVIAGIKAYDRELLIDELTKSLTNNDSTLENEQIKELNAQIKEKKLASSNLVKQLSLAPNNDVASIIMNEISSINNELKELQNNLNNMECDKNEIVNQTVNLELIIDSLKHLNENIDTVDDISKKRILIQSVASKVLWDGDNYKSIVKILGMNDF